MISDMAMRYRVKRIAKLVEISYSIGMIYRTISKKICLSFKNYEIYTRATKTEIPASVS
jgi:hypothetical protein